MHHCLVNCVSYCVMRPSATQQRMRWTVVAVNSNTRSRACCDLPSHTNLLQAAEISKLQSERTSLTATVEGAQQLEAELQDLRSRAKEAVQVQQQLLELRAAQEQLQELKAEMRQLQGTKEELELTLQQHTQLRQAVASSEKKYEELVAAAERAAQLQAEMADLQVKHCNYCCRQG